jgi:PTS system mannose-specific IIA component
VLGIVVVTHGQLANELVSAAEMIVGEIPNINAVSIGWQESPEEADREIKDALARVDQGKGVVLLTDMFGGTPSNVSLTFLEKDKVEVVTGVNLPMLIKLVSLREQEKHSLLEIARLTCAQGKESIYQTSDLLSGKRGKETQKDTSD